MNFTELIETLVQETARTSLPLFAPELALCAAILGLLFVRLFQADRWFPPYWVAMLGTLVAFVCAFVQFLHLKMDGAEPGGLLNLLFDVLHLPASGGPSTEFFTGLLVFDKFTVFFRLFLLLFLILVIALTVLSGIPDTEDGPDFYTLLLGSVVGMLLMSAANNLLILFLGVEMASVPSYALVGFLKGRRLSSEAALKFVVYGGGAAGVMLYGTSLIAGLLGTTHMPLIAERMRVLIGTNAVLTNPALLTVVLGAMMVFVGLAFKLSLVPFHFWCPDAFEGASAEVAGFLSVASKGAAFALLVRFCLNLIGPDPGHLAEVYLTLGVGLGVIAAVTTTFGNLAAYAQSNVKRLLAYSTIAHAGYMLMAVAAMIVVLNAPADAGLHTTFEATRALEGLLYYLSVYLFMNLGAFAIVAIIRNHTFSEEIDAYRGLWQESPALCVCMLICLFSLVGLPPLGGFVGKYMVFAALFQAGKVHPAMWAILVIGGLNTVFSLFYYLRVLKAMFLEPRPEGAPRVEVRFRPDDYPGLYVVMVSLPILILGMTPVVDHLSITAGNVAAALIR